MGYVCLGAVAVHLVCAAVVWVCCRRAPVEKWPGQYG